MKDILKHNASHIVLAFLLLIALGMVVPHWDNTARMQVPLYTAPQMRGEVIMQRMDKQADAEVKTASEAYAHMSDTELTHGDAEAYK